MSFDFYAYASEGYISKGVRFSAASPGDIEKLDEKIKKLELALSKKATNEELKDKGDYLSNKIEKLKSTIKDHKNVLKNELESGEWKNLFHGEITTLLHTLEERHKEINIEINKKMTELRSSVIQLESIKQILLQHENEMIKLIKEKGNLLINDLEQKNEKYLSQVTEELHIAAKNITWK